MERDVDVVEAQVDAEDQSAIAFVVETNRRLNGVDRRLPGRQPRRQYQGAAHQDAGRHLISHGFSISLAHIIRWPSLKKKIVSFVDLSGNERKWFGNSID